MKVVIPGGSGHVGTLLARAFHATGDEVVVISRSPRGAAWRMVAWDGATQGQWAQEIDGADVVINLAGRSVNCRYNARNRAEILDSRVRSVRAVATAIGASARPPKTWLQASTATIYAHRFDAANDESNGKIGGGEPNAPGTWRFSIDVARAWEAALVDAHVPRTRKVLLRSAMTMSPDPGGIFDTLYGLVRLGLGGRAGNGRQFVSWVHDADFIRALRWLIAHEEMSGVVNVASPNPLPHAEFMRILRRAVGMPFGLSGSAWMVEIATLIHRTESELILKSRRVVPTRLSESGFEFRFPNWPEAAEDLVRRRQHAGRVAA